jgi:transcriptional regulator with XRE-family HTH domain
VKDAMSNACMQCGTEMIAGQEDRPCADLPGVLLRGVDVYRCPKCGDYEVAIPRIDELHEVLARAILAKRTTLVRQERRFLRNFIGWTAEELALRMGVSPEAVDAWERGGGESGPVAERLLRVLAAVRLPGGGSPDEALALISSHAAPLHVEVRADDHGWRDAA